MKFYHYYASPSFPDFETEQPNPLELATSQIMDTMVRALIERHALGRTPYHLGVPRSVLFEAHEWRIPTTLLLIDPIEEKENDISPIAMATLSFHSGVVFIWGRRLLKYER